MEIKQNGISGSRVIETNNLSKISASILEKADKLSVLCRDNGKQCFLFVEADHEFHSFANLKSDTTLQAPTEADYLKLMNGLSHSIYYFSKGNYCIKQSTP